MKLQLDEWQKKVVETTGNLVVRSGRQCGKSTAISIKAGQFAIQNPKKTILVIAAVERQAQLLFEKLLGYLMDGHAKEIKGGKDKPTKHKIKLKNGSVIHCLPTGLTGYGIRGYTVDLLIADEAAFIPDEVWTAVTPMLAVTKGTKILLSTPFGKRGYFYECFNDPNYTSFHVSSEGCKRIPKEFLDHEKERMTKLQYAQEYLGEFLDELMQFFPTKLIKDICTGKRVGKKQEKSYFMGIDVARMGGDETTFEILDRTDRKNIKQVESIVKKDMLTTQTARMTVHLEKAWGFKKIYIDDGGLGVGVFDQLMEEETTRRKTEPINNARRSLDRDEKRKKKLMKEDLYSNLLRLMERGEIELLDEEDLKMSLMSIQYEYTDDGRLKIWGSYSHIAEGLIRAAWCAKDKSLNIYIYF